jgi:hypothetical protein
MTEIEPGVEEIAVPEMPEPDGPEEGAIDPADTYTEDRPGLAAARTDEPCGLPDNWEDAG